MAKGGRYVFLEATEEEKAQAELMAKGLDAKPKVYWRFEQIIKDSPDLERFQIYHKDLVKFNSKINLVSKKSIYNGDILHFVDSFLSGQKILDSDNSEVIYDFGSGNGFPGLVMAILDQDRRFILVDKDTRKIEFIKFMASKLRLKNVEARCTDLVRLEPHSVSCAVSRGLASLTKALLLSSKTFVSGGSYYHLKGPLWSNELGEMPPQLLNHWKPEMFFEYKLPKGLGERFIVKTIYKL